MKMNEYKDNATGATVKAAQWDGRVVTAEAWQKDHGFGYEAATHRLVVPAADGHRKVVVKDQYVAECPDGSWEVWDWQAFLERYALVEAKGGRQAT